MRLSMTERSRTIFQNCKQRDYQCRKRLLLSGVHEGRGIQLKLRAHRVYHMLFDIRVIPIAANNFDICYAS